MRLRALLIVLLVATLLPLSGCIRFWREMNEMSAALSALDAMFGGGDGIYGAGEDYPAYYVSWHDAQEFIVALSRHLDATNQDGVSVRLPSEAEWEYACRAGTTTIFYWGDSWDENDKYTWYKNGLFQTYPVGGKLPNAYGLYDMIGNVYEWCQDWHAAYPDEPQTDPTGPETGVCRILRGGGLWSDGRPTSTHRWHLLPDRRTVLAGFRVAASIGATCGEEEGEAFTPPDELTLMLPGDVALALVRIPGGTFMMGRDMEERKADEQESTAKLKTHESSRYEVTISSGKDNGQETVVLYENESPPHEVTISNDFYMGMYEVTQQQWLAVMGAWPDKEPKCRNKEGEHE